MGDPSEISKYFRRRTPQPHHPNGMVGNTKQPRIGTELNGALKFTQPELESAVFRRGLPAFPDIFRRRAPLPRRPIGGRGGEKLQRTSRKTDEPHGAQRNATDLLNPQALPAARHISAGSFGITQNSWRLPPLPLSGKVGNPKPPRAKRKTTGPLGALRQVADR